MEVILTDDVVGVGDIGEKVTVKPGFARNYLIPRGLAMESESRNASMLAHKMKQVEAKKSSKSFGRRKGEKLNGACGSTWITGRNKR